MPKKSEPIKINFFWSSDGRPVKKGDKFPRSVEEKAVLAVLSATDSGK